MGCCTKWAGYAMMGKPKMADGEELGKDSAHLMGAMSSGARQYLVQFSQKRYQ
jgi:hypothetical protein